MPFPFVSSQSKSAGPVRLSPPARVQPAKAGEPWAVRELLDRCIGKARLASDDTGEPLDAVRFVVTMRGVE